MAKKPKKHKRPPGLAPGCFRKVRRDFVDQDYTDDLPDDAKQWLSDFNEGFYNARFVDGQEPEWTDRHKTKAYAANYAANNDWYAIGKAANRADSLDQPDAPEHEGHSRAERLPDPQIERDWDDRGDQQYFDHPVYKAALRRFRDAMPSRGKPASDDYDEAERELLGVVRLGRAGLLP